MTVPSFFLLKDGRSERQHERQKRSGVGVTCAELCGSIKCAFSLLSIDRGSTVHSTTMGTMRQRARTLYDDDVVTSVFGARNVSRSLRHWGSNKTHIHRTVICYSTTGSRGCPHPKHVTSFLHYCLQLAGVIQAKLYVKNGITHCSRPLLQ